MAELCEYRDVIFEALENEEAPKRSRTPSLNNSFERSNACRQSSCYSDNLSLDMAEARWELLETLLVEERQAREAEFADLRKELAIAKDEVKEVKEHLAFSLECNTKSVSIQEEFNSITTKLREEFDSRFGEIRSQLLDSFQQALALQKVPITLATMQTTDACQRPSLWMPANYNKTPQTQHREPLLPMPSVMLSSSPGIERRISQRLSSSSEVEDPVPRIYTERRYTSDSAARQQSLPPAQSAVYTGPSVQIQQVSMPSQGARAQGTDGSNLQRDIITARSPPMSYRGVNASSSTQSQSQKVLPSYQQLNRHWEKASFATRGSSPTTTYRQPIPSPLVLSRQVLKISAN